MVITLGGTCMGVVFQVVVVLGGSYPRGACPGVVVRVVVVLGGSCPGGLLTEWQSS